MKHATTEQIFQNFTFKLISNKFFTKDSSNLNQLFIEDYLHLIDFCLTAFYLSNSTPTTHIFSKLIPNYINTYIITSYSLKINLYIVVTIISNLSILN